MIKNDKKVSMRFFLHMIPPTVTAQEHRVTKRGIYMSDRQKAAYVKIRDALAPHAPDKPIDSACQLVVKWCFPTDGTHSSSGEYKYTKPDTDNLNKMLKDIMEELKFFTNDARVASEVIEKFWSDVPGIFISLSEL